MSAPTQRSRWRLASVKIRSFRGMASEHTIAFDGRSGLLHGYNGVGKSTIAQCIQWTLYGRFPAEVLANTSFSKFLAPVSAKKKKAWYGQVTLERGDEVLVITRDEDNKEFSVEIDARCHSGAEAASKLDSLLGVDMSGFVRTALLHQGRIRGLLLDSPKERNAALDRFLGMDDIESIFARLKPKDFLKAAADWRAQIVADRQRYETREQLLVAQRDEAQNRARELRFLNKDFNVSGLRKAYAKVGVELARLAGKYDVEIDPLPACESVEGAGDVSAAVAASLSSLRTKSKLQARLAPISAAMARLTNLASGWKVAVDARDAASSSQARWIEEWGEHAAVVEKHVAGQAALVDTQNQLKAAGELRQLLRDANTYIDSHPKDACPVCEQSVASAAELTSALARRVQALATGEIAEGETAVSEARAVVDALTAALAGFAASERELAESQRGLDEFRQRVVEALGGQGIAENKVEARIAAELAELDKSRLEIAAGVTAMEAELGAIDLRERTISQGLVPVLKTRADLARLEDAWNKTSESHARSEQAASELEVKADQVERLRTALLAAKNQLASDTLGEASPRANQLYQALVRHPVFDTMQIATTPRANKIDYAFEVSAKGVKKTIREARMVLSDGQLTATAIGLFFAFSDSASHGLDLLYVDDPTQNLDLPCKEAMAKQVVALADRRQVIVATHDEDFVSFLEAEGFFDCAVVHHLEAWNGNPRVTSKMPG